MFWPFDNPRVCAAYNFDHPDAFDTAAMLDCLNNLKVCPEGPAPSPLLVATDWSASCPTEGHRPLTVSLPTCSVKAEPLLQNFACPVFRLDQRCDGRYVRIHLFLSREAYCSTSPCLCTVPQSSLLGWLARPCARWRCRSMTSRGTSAQRRRGAWSPQTWLFWRCEEGRSPTRHAVPLLPRQVRGRPGYKETALVAQQ